MYKPSRTVIPNRVGETVVLSSPVKEYTLTPEELAKYNKIGPARNQDGEIVRPKLVLRPGTKEQSRRGLETRIRSSKNK